MLSYSVLLLLSTYLVTCQRPSFAGFRPIGFPELQNNTNDDLGNRFGEDGQPLPLPIEANGDRALVNRISKLPLDQQPFWYINWKALEANRQNPQKYDQRPNVFIDQASNTMQNNMNVNENTTNVNQNQNNLNSRFNTETTQVPSQAPVHKTVTGQRTYRQYY